LLSLFNFINVLQVHNSRTNLQRTRSRT